MDVATVEEGRQISRRAAAVILTTLAAFILLEGVWSYRRPIHRDVSIYAVIGHEMLRGRPLYSDLLELRPPAVMVTYAAAEAVLGYGRHTILTLYVAASVVAMLGIYYAASARGGGRMAGLWAAAFWAALSGSYVLEAGEPNTEVFMNACLAWAFGLWLRSDEISSRTRRMLAVGALFALASLYKHVVIVCPALLAAAHVLLPPAAGRGGRRRALADVALIAAVGVGVWAGVFGYFAATGRADIFSKMMVGASLDYAAAGNASFAVARPGALRVIANNILAPLRGEAEFLLDMMTPLVLTASLGGAVGIFRQPRRWGFLLAFAVATWIAIALPGQFWGHYYQLWVPPLAVGAGWALASLRAAGRRAGRLAHTAGAVVLLLLLATQLPLYRANAAGDWASVEYDETLWPEPLARELDTLLAPGETFYEWGGNPALYFYNGRRAPSGILMVEWFLRGALSAQLSQQVISDLEREQPELLVVAKKVWPANPDDNPVSRWLSGRYYPLSEQNERGPFALYVRRGGNLEARLRGGG
jgi:4-amino-4-deoxy-L-arabinose transferase-like glycosyltransferase